MISNFGANHFAANHFRALRGGRGIGYGAVPRSYWVTKAQPQRVLRKRRQDDRPHIEVETGITQPIAARTRAGIRSIQPVDGRVLQALKSPIFTAQAHAGLLEAAALRAGMDELYLAQANMLRDALMWLADVLRIKARRRKDEEDILLLLAMLA